MDLLNARRRHRLDHFGLLSSPTHYFSCSTPGGVIVSITTWGRWTRTIHRLLNARRRHRLDHRPLVSPCKLTSCEGRFQAPTEERGDCIPLRSIKPACLT